MRVIEKGREQKGWSKECKCTGKGNGDGGCGAKLLVERGDLFVTTNTCRDETDYYLTFRCSECEVLTDIPENQAPAGIIRELRSKAERSRQRECVGRHGAGCGKIVNVSPDDYILDRNIAAGREINASFQCPSCDKFTEVRLDEVPDHILGKYVKGIVL